MYAPARDDESTTLAEYIDQQLEAIRAATFGLTEAQARQTPCRSSLSIGGIVKHTAHGMRGAVRMLREGGADQVLDQEAFAAYQGSFVLGDDQTMAQVLEEFDQARADYLATIRATDPDAESTSAPTPWTGVTEPRPMNQRFYLLHQVEEMARHAGHADIIREQLDGMAVPNLVMSLAGMPANPFFTPYAAAPGTIGAD